MSFISTTFSLLYQFFMMAAIHLAGLLGAIFAYVLLAILGAVLCPFYLIALVVSRLSRYGYMAILSVVTGLAKVVLQSFSPITTPVARRFAPALNVLEPLLCSLLGLGIDVNPPPRSIKKKKQLKSSSAWVIYNPYTLLHRLRELTPYTLGLIKANMVAAFYNSMHKVGQLLLSSPMCAPIRRFAQLEHTVRLLADQMNVIMEQIRFHDQVIQDLINTLSLTRPGLLLGNVNQVQTSHAQRLNTGSQTGPMNPEQGQGRTLSFTPTPAPVNQPRMEEDAERPVRRSSRTFAGRIRRRTARVTSSAFSAAPASNERRSPLFGRSGSLSRLGGAAWARIRRLASPLASH